jgi:multiple sugar transport system permease protein
VWERPVLARARQKQAREGKPAVRDSASAIRAVALQPRAQTHASRRRIQWSAYLYILPAFVIIAVFHILPVFYALFISLNRGPVNRFIFIGLGNYLRALTGPEFWSSFSVTFLYAFLTMPVSIVLGLFFAYLLFQRVRGQAVYRTIFFLPYVVATVGSSVVWAWIFDPATGLANVVLGWLGVPPQRWLIEPAGLFDLLGRAGWPVPAWLHGPSLALVAVAIFTVWQSMGYDVIIFLAGLTNIPAELYEVARIDGGNGVQLFRYITVPLLAPTTFFIVIISVIGSLQSFNQIFAMNTAAAQQLGGPLGSTATLTVYMFNQLYTFSDYGYASAVAVLLSLVILGLTVFNLNILGKGGDA